MNKSTDTEPTTKMWGYEIQDPFAPGERATLNVLKAKLEKAMAEFETHDKQTGEEDADARFFALVNKSLGDLSSPDDKLAFSYMVNEVWVGDDFETPACLAERMEVGAMDEEGTLKSSNSTFECDGYRDGFTGIEPSKSRESVQDDEYMRGYESGVEDRSKCHDIAAFVIRMLDGDPITQFETFEDFKSWLDTVNAYDEMDQEPEELEPNEELLEIVYSKLVEAAQQATAKKSTSMRLG
ncbi:hypothetical protein VQ574_21170 (plasmid) [Stutzerimonas frequens]|uniref:hypothetical protein n=1 Tax=Stutzerimonas frequens TaxID=2968969 RepID=UPI002DBDE0C1|nr:hypothetical protein [Stutzerimonas frequens]WRW29451.1 hypothetical protein VQ574_21170 [Stutzerimonas frequens]